MATSGSTDFNLTRDDIITEAYELLGVLGEGQTPTSDQITRASRTLNMLIKSWQADSMNLFAVQRCALFTNKGQQKYQLGPNTPDNYTTLDQIQQLSVAVAQTAGNTTVELDDASGLQDGDYIGLIAGVTAQWTTINGAPAGNVVTLTDPLVNDANVGDIVWSYRDKIGRPMEVMEGYTHQTRSNTDIPVEKLSRRKYDTLSSKFNTGRINQFYYDKQRGTGDLYVWPTGDDEADYLLLIVQRTLEDVDVGTDDFDFPQEWFLPLATNLALGLATKVGVEQDTYYEVKAEAEKWYDICKDWDEEVYTSVELQPDLRFSKT